MGECVFEFLDEVLAQVNAGKRGPVVGQYHEVIAAEIDRAIAATHDQRPDMATARFVLREEVQVIPWVVDSLDVWRTPKSDNRARNVLHLKLRAGSDYVDYRRIGFALPWQGMR